MRFIILAAILAFGLAGEARAYDATGVGSTKDPTTCSTYLDAYSKTTLTGDASFEGPHAFFKAHGWINGVISGYNHSADNGKQDIVAGMSYNDTSRWVASWCRDNPSKGLDDAVFALIFSRLAK